MTRGTTSIMYLFEGAFSLWRRRLKGVYAAARERGWHVEPVNADDEGVTSKDEILAVRVREAKRLLSDTDIPVSLVAEKCGYGNERSLRYIFAKATGVSPIEWRRNGVGS